MFKITTKRIFFFGLLVALGAAFVTQLGSAGAWLYADALALGSIIKLSGGKKASTWFAFVMGLILCPTLYALISADAMMGFPAVVVLFSVIGLALSPTICILGGISLFRSTWISGWIVLYRLGIGAYYSFSGTESLAGF